MPSPFALTWEGQLGLGAGALAQVWAFTGLFYSKTVTEEQPLPQFNKQPWDHFSGWVMAHQGAEKRKKHRKNVSFVHLSVHSFIQQTFPEHLLCARH